MGFKDNLKEELKYQDIRIKELSEKTQISIGTLNHYLAEKSTEPTVENAVKIARALNVSVEYLVTGQTHFLASDNIHIDLYKKYYRLFLKIDTLEQSSIDALAQLIDNLK